MTIKEGVLAVLWFILEDKNGRCGTASTMGVSGGLLFDEKDNHRGWLIAGAHENEGSLLLFDNNGKVRAALNRGRPGPALQLFNWRGDPCAVLDLDKDAPKLTLIGLAEEDSVPVVLPVIKNRSMKMIHGEEGGKPIWGAP